MTSYAWVIEEASSPVSAPRYYTLRPNATHFWSHDHADALRFARKQDAEDYVSHFVQVDGARVCEHGWDAPGDDGCDCPECKPELHGYDSAPTDSHHGGKIWKPEESRIAGLEALLCDSEAALADEREECAKAAEAAIKGTDNISCIEARGAEKAAKAIRARR